MVTLQKRRKAEPLDLVEGGELRRGAMDAYIGKKKKQLVLAARTQPLSSTFPGDQSFVLCRQSAERLQLSLEHQRTSVR